MHHALAAGNAGSLRCDRFANGRVEAVGVGGKAGSHFEVFMRQWQSSFMLLAVFIGGCSALGSTVATGPVTGAWGGVHGDRMTLRVVVGADTLGPLDLQQGAAPQLFRCL